MPSCCSWGACVILQSPSGAPQEQRLSAVGWQRLEQGQSDLSIVLAAVRAANGR